MKNQNQIEFQKKVKYFIVPFIVFVYINVSFSQEQYIPGYILSLKGDTLNGEIKDQGGFPNSQMVIFRENENASVQYFRPGEITAFFISNNNYYESKIFNYYQEIPIKTLRLIVNTSMESKDRSAYEIKRDTAFLRVIVKGKAQLYDLTDEAGQLMYFVETPNGGLKHLRHHKTYSPRKNGDVKFKTLTSINDTLQLLVSDCHEDLFVENRRKIYLSDLIYLLLDYNSCIDSESEIIQPKLKVKVKFGLNLGVNYTNVFPRGKQDEIIENYQFKIKQGIMVGGIVDCYIPKVKEKWVIQTEFSYNQKGANPGDDYLKLSYYHPDIILDTFKIKLNFEYIDFGMYFKYFINSNNRLIRPYISMGMVFGYQINNEDPFLIVRKNGENVAYYDMGYIPESEFGFAGKTGILYRINKHIGVYGEFRASVTELYYNKDLAKFTNTLYGFTLGLYL